MKFPTLFAVYELELDVVYIEQIRNLFVWTLFCSVTADIGH